VNQHAKYQGQMSFTSKVTIWTHIHTNPAMQNSRMLAIPNKNYLAKNDVLLIHQHRCSSD